MSEVDLHEIDADRSQAAAAFVKADLACAFGPSFFLGHLGRFVRDRCPEAAENLPLVQVRLADGDILDVCHIIGVSPRWVMLAVQDKTNQRDDMAIELVPYELIRRVAIATRRSAAASIGFSQARPPEIISPETLLRGAMAQPVSTAPAAHDA